MYNSIKDPRMWWSSGGGGGGELTGPGLGVCDEPLKRDVDVVLLFTRYRVAADLSVLDGT